MKNDNITKLKKNMNNGLINNLKKNHLNKNDYHVIFKNFEKNPRILKKKFKKLAKLLGKTLPQDKSGKKFLEVTPNVSLLKKLTKQNQKKLLRYHQNNFFVSVHSDGPQLESPPKYLMLACLKQAKRGGHSIITYANKVYDFLKRKKPNYLKILKKNFLMERRGFNYPNENIFEKTQLRNDLNFNFSDKIIFKNVSFKYESSNQYILNNLKKSQPQLARIDFLLDYRTFLVVSICLNLIMKPE